MPARLVLACLAAVALLVPGCTTPEAPPAALTACRVQPEGPTLAERGIGGTGAPAGPELADRGIGGTGVIGVITGFGSICLDGLEVAVGATVPVAVDGVNASADILRTGQLAIVDAMGEAGGLRARRIAVRHEVTGPIEAIGGEAPGGVHGDASTQSLVVAGQRVVLDGVPEGDALLAIGNWITVSGLRGPDEAIIATRLDRAPAGQAAIHGRVTVTPDGSRAGVGRIGAARLNLRPGIAPRTGAVTVEGSYRDGVLEVRRMAADPFVDKPTSLFEGRVGTFVIETYVNPAATASMPGPVVGDLISPVQGLGGQLAAGFAVLTLQRDRAGTLRATGVAPSTGIGAGATPMLVPPTPLPAVIVPPASPAAAGAAAPAPAAQQAAPAGSATPGADTTAPSAGAAASVTPSAATPSAATPAPAPNLSTPAIATPSVTTPTVAAPTVTAPTVTAPGVSAPAATSTPSVSAPVTAPTVSAPIVTTPTVTTPTATAPTATAPTVTTPTVTTPTVTAPAATTPTVTTPAVTTPTGSAPAATPSVTTPTTTTPTAVTPAMRTPSVSLPATTTPGVSLPSTSTPTPATSLRR